MKENNVHSIPKQYAFVISTAGDIPTGFLTLAANTVRKFSSSWWMNLSLFVKLIETTDGDVGDYLDINVFECLNPSWGCHGVHACFESWSWAGMNPGARNEFSIKLWMSLLTQWTLISIVSSLLNQSCGWTLEGAGTLAYPVWWGLTCQALHDLTAAALFMVSIMMVKRMLISVSHAFFPRVSMLRKS